MCVAVSECVWFCMGKFKTVVTYWWRFYFENVNTQTHELFSNYFGIVLRAQFLDKKVGWSHHRGWKSHTIFITGLPKIKGWYKSEIEKRKPEHGKPWVSEADESEFNACSEGLKWNECPYIVLKGYGILACPQVPIHIPYIVHTITPYHVVYGQYGLYDGRDNDDEVKNRTSKESNRALIKAWIREGLCDVWIFLKISMIARYF